MRPGDWSLLLRFEMRDDYLSLGMKTRRVFPSGELSPDKTTAAARVQSVAVPYPGDPDYPAAPRAGGKPAGVAITTMGRAQAADRRRTRLPADEPRGSQPVLPPGGTPLRAR